MFRSSKAISRIADKQSNSKNILKLNKVSKPDKPTHDWVMTGVSDGDGLIKRIDLILNKDFMPSLSKNCGKSRLVLEETIKKKLIGAEMIRPRSYMM